MVLSDRGGGWRWLRACILACILLLTTQCARQCTRAKSLEHDDIVAIAPTPRSVGGAPVASRQAVRYAHLRPLSDSFAEKTTVFPSDPLSKALPLELLLRVHVNYQLQPEEALILKMSDGRFYAKEADLDSWRLRRPEGLFYSDPEHGTNRFYSLDSITGLTYRLDETNQELWISAPASAFASSELADSQPEDLLPQSGLNGAFLNYSLLINRATPMTADSLFMDFGLFNQLGLGTSDFVYSQNGPVGGKTWLRVNTAWVHDFPEKMRTLRFGDSFTQAGIAGIPVPFGGVQYGVNFATQPYFVPFPLPSYSGLAATASDVEVYVNGLLVKKSQTSPGPYLIPIVPIDAGPGEFTVVTRDLFGNITTVNVPFYSSADLLRPGLDSFSFSFGWQRQHLGVTSGDYGPFLSSVLYQYGLTENLTGELRFDQYGASQTTAMGAVWLPNPAVGLFRGEVAVTHAGTGDGEMLQVGWQRQGALFSASAQAQYSSAHFNALGYPVGYAVPRLQLAADLGVSLPIATVTLAYVRQDSPLLGPLRMISVGSTFTTSRFGFFNLSAVRDLAQPGSSGIFLGLTYPFGQSGSVSVGAGQQGGAQFASFDLTQGLPPSDGFGYRFGATNGASGTTSAELDYQDSVNAYSLVAARVGDQDNYQGQISGSIGVVASHGFESRRIGDAFALVEVPGVENATVLLDNQPVARTGTDGSVVLPTLRPYQRNSIALDVASLPLDAVINSLEQEVTAPYGGAALVNFHTKKSWGVTFKLLLPDGQPVPAGSTLTINGQDLRPVVGYDGVAYIENLTSGATITAHWQAAHCQFTLARVSGEEIIEDLGDVLCRM